MTNGERRDDLIQAPDPDAEANEIALGQLMWLIAWGVGIAWLIWLIGRWLR